MAKSNFDSEIKSSMAEKKGAPPSPKAPARPRSPPVPRPPSGADTLPPNVQRGADPTAIKSVASNMPGPPDLHHVNAAASIAHAILGNRGP